MARGTMIGLYVTVIPVMTVTNGSTEGESFMATPKKWVYRFTEVEDAEKYAGDWEGVRTLLGGKGANLAEMTRINVPVPPGFTASRRPPTTRS